MDQAEVGFSIQDYLELLLVEEFAEGLHDFFVMAELAFHGLLEHTSEVILYLFLESLKIINYLLLCLLKILLY